MLTFQCDRFYVPQATTPICVQMVQMDVSRSFFLRNVGANQLRTLVEESANGSTWSEIPSLERTLDPGQGASLLVESSYPFVRISANGNSELEVGTVGSFLVAPMAGLGLLVKP